MPWVKLSDDWYDDPKVIEAGDDGGWLWVVALSWSARNLTDGVIPKRQLPRLTTLPKPEALAARLVEIGLFSVVDGGWQIANYHDYQPTRDSVLAKRKADADRKATGKAKDSVRNPRGIQTESARPGPVPVPVEDHPHDSPVDNVLAAIVEMRMKEATKAGKVKHPTAYKRTVVADVEALRPEAEAAVAAFDALPYVIAEYVEGRRDARWMPRRQEVS